MKNVSKMTFFPAKYLFVSQKCDNFAPDNDKK